MIDINEYGNIRYYKQEKVSNIGIIKLQKKLLQKLQKINTNMGATNEQTNENKVQGKNKTKFLY